MGESIFLLSIGAILILAGVFKWYLILAFFARHYKVRTNKGVMFFRILSIIFGVALILGTM